MNKYELTIEDKEPEQAYIFIETNPFNESNVNTDSSALDSFLQGNSEGT